MLKNRNRKLLALDGAVMLVLLFADQFTKYLAITRLKGNPAYVLIEGVLELQYVENRGIAFSLFQGRKILILTLGLLILGLLIFFLFKLPEQKKFRIIHFLFAALLAGALGNIIDRVRFDYVVDFISFVLIQYPVFNVADCFIVLATIILFVLFMFVYKEEDLEFLSFRRKKTAE